MEAKFISNVDPDDAAAVLNSIDVAHSIFVLVSKSGTTLETLTNESFVKDALKKAGLDASKHMIAVTSETSRLQRAMTIWQLSSWMTISADVSLLHPQSVAPYYPWHSDRKYLQNSLEGAAAEDKLAQTKMLCRTRLCWMH